MSYLTPSTPEGTLVPQEMDAFSDFLNKLLVKLKTSLLNQMCSSIVDVAGKV